MNKVRIILGIFLPDICGIVVVSVPMIIFLSITHFMGTAASGLPAYGVVFILLLILSVLLLPFRLVLIAVQILRFEINRYGIFAVSIIGGLISGALFYFLIPSRFTTDWSGILNYALLGVIHSLIIQAIYEYLPSHWKMEPIE